MEMYKLAVFVCFVIFNLSEANPNFKRNATESPVRLFNFVPIYCND